jgi:hypothetical protein
MAMIKKSFIATITILIILISLLVGLQAIEVAKANPAPYDSSGTSNLEVSIISPQNKTYDTNNIELIANFGAFPGVWYISYSLDGGSYIEIAPGHPLSHTLTETLSLSKLPKGSHSIEVKATAMGGPGGQVTACAHVYFTVTKTLEPQLPSPSPTPTSSPTANLTPTPTIPEFPSWIIPLPFAVIVIIAGLLVYFRKYKHNLVKKL